MHTPVSQQAPHITTFDTGISVKGITIYLMSKGKKCVTVVTEP